MWLPNPGTILLLFLLFGAFIWIQDLQAAYGTRAISPASTAASTVTLPYQGHLTDTSGWAVTGVYPMRFRLYATAEGSIHLWEEVRIGSDSVQVTDGLFNVWLGSVTPIPQALLTDYSALWLGVAVSADHEMIPRVPLGTVPFAVRAATVNEGSITTGNLADGAVTAEKLSADALPSQIPVGTVISWWRPTLDTPLPSDEWAIADGSLIIDTDSPFYNQALPDLTDRFIMGVTVNDIGSLGGVNTLNLSHSHTVNAHSHSIPSHAHSSGTLYALVALEHDRVYIRQSGPLFQATIANHTGSTHVNTHVTDGGAAVEGNTGSWSGTTGTAQPGTNTQLSSITDNRPQYIGLLFLVRIK